MDSKHISGDDGDVDVVGFQTTTVAADNASLEKLEEKEIEAHPTEVTATAQAGVQKVEAAALVWSRTAVYCTYAWIWVCFFVLALQQGMTTQLNAVAYADFASAPQLTTAYVLSTIIGGVLKLPIAKTLNLWGRAEGFVVFTSVLLLGMIVIASCTGPAGYAAGYVLYWVGYDAVYFIMDVFVADTSGLRNRAWAFAFVSTPFICTAFTAPLAATSFIDQAGWRWAYGAFVIIMFVTFMPLAVVFKFYQIRAAKLGLFVRTPHGRTLWQSVIHHAREFDLVGAAILMAAFILFLLPFTLETYGLADYNTPKFIAMVVIGVLLFPVFYLWENYYAAPEARFVKWELLRQRTVLGACVLAAVLYFSYYAWDNYYYSFVVVVFDLDTSMAGYMGQIYNIGSCFWGVVFGIYVRQTRHFKNACLFFGLPLTLLGAGLMIYFRSADHGIGYLVMCQIFIAFAGGTLVIGEQMAVMAAADHDGVPVMLALIGLSSSVGGAIGYAVAAAIYNNTFAASLLSALPASAQADWETIYNGGYLVQQAYPVGSAVRDAINYAWGRSQMYECIAATAILLLGFPSIMVWKNYNVDRKQNKGVVI